MRRFRSMRRRLLARPCRALAVAAGLAAPEMAEAQVPLPPTGPVPAPVEPARHRGFLHRALRHMGFTLHDRFIGYPEEFIEPPLGYFVSEVQNVQKSKADPHEFFLYQSDFVQGTTTLSPGGALRLTDMANRLPCWLGPIVVEWTPEEPALAERRRAAVLALMQQAGITIGPERLVVGPSPYPGLLGDLAAQEYPIMLQRAARALNQYTLPPNPPGEFTPGAFGSGR